MCRNLSGRVEACVPVRRRELRTRLWDVLMVCLADRRSAWQMLPDGTYRQLQPEAEDGADRESTHAALMRMARARHAAYLGPIDPAG